jgi:hypothetical protein
MTLTNEEIKEFAKQVALTDGDSEEQAEVFAEETMVELFPFTIKASND